LSLLAANLPRSLALTIKTTEIASMETTAAFPTQKVMPQKSPLAMVLLAMLEVVVAVEEDEDVVPVVVAAVDAVVADGEDVVPQVVLHPLQPPLLLLGLLLLQMPLLKRGMMRSKWLPVVVADVDEERVMRGVLKRKRKRRRIPSPFLSMRTKNSTRTARNSAATSATVANATSVTSAAILTRLDLQLGILSSPVVDDDEPSVVLVNPKPRVSASITVTTRSANTEMNADSSMVRMTSVKKCNLAHSAKLLGNVTNSVTRVTANLEIDADSLTTRPALLVVMMPMLMLMRKPMRSNRNVYSARKC